ncbi:hypothetical protein D3C76_584900 [compost metagenome]
MRCERRQHLHEVLCRFSGQGLLLVGIIDENHQLADRCIEAQLLEVLGNLLERLMPGPFELVGAAVQGNLRANAAVLIHEQAPYAGEEAVDTFHTFFIPWLRCFQRPHEHFIDTKRIRAISFHNFIRVNDIAARFTHLFIVIAQDHPLVHQLVERLLRIHYTNIVQNLVPKTGIEQMQYRMLSSADVQVNRQPFLLLLR